MVENAQNVDFSLRFFVLFFFFVVRKKKEQKKLQTYKRRRAEGIKYAWKTTKWANGWLFVQAFLPLAVQMQWDFSKHTHINRTWGMRKAHVHIAKQSQNKKSVCRQITTTKGTKLNMVPLFFTSRIIWQLMYMPCQKKNI